MLNQAFFKRITPFILTLALGLFVASFFVSIAPAFKGKRTRCFEKNKSQNLRYENEQLRMENQRLQQKLNESEKMMLLDELVPPPPPLARQK